MAANSVVIGVVAEGKRDQMALEKVIEHLREMKSPPAAVTTRRLQPAYADATRRTMTEGGSDWVRKWCQTPPAKRVEQVFSPPFTSPETPPCHVVIILHDADRLSEISTHSNLSLPDEPYDATKRAKYVESVLDSWLWPSADDRTAANRYSDHVPLAAVWALETWYVAALDPDGEGFEEIDPVPRMIDLRPEMEDPKKIGKLRKVGVDRQYDQLNRRLVAAMDRVERTCPQLGRLASEIRGRLTPKSEFQAMARS